VFSKANYPTYEQNKKNKNIRDKKTE